MRHHVIDDLIAKHMPENAYAEQWDAVGLRERLREVVGIDFPVEDWAKEEGIADEEIRERVTKAADELYAAKREKYGPEIMGQVEKTFLLRTLDQLWRDHIITVEQLRQVIHLRGYGQRDPLNEYKTEGYTLFESDGQQAARERHRPGDARRSADAQADDLDDLPDEDELPDMEAHHIDAFTGEDDVGEGMLLIDMEQDGEVTSHRSQGPVDLGQGRPQRTLPLRLRQEIQALPRRLCLTSNRVCGTRFDLRIGDCQTLGVKSASRRAGIADRSHHAGIHVIGVVAMEGPGAGIVGIEHRW